MPSQQYAVVAMSVAIAYGINILVNVGSSSGWFGRTNAEVSQLHPTPLTPAGWAFSIWGVIFTLQGAGTVALFLNSNSEQHMAWKERLAAETLRWWIVGWALQCIWQVSFSRNTKLSLTLCAFLLVSALAAFQMALVASYKVRRDAGAESELGDLPTSIYVLYYVPTAINAAWLSVATSVGIVMAAQLYLASVTWLALALAAAIVAVGMHACLTHHDIAYGLTLVWSFVAVYARQKGACGATAVASAIAVAVVVLVTIMTTLTRIQQAPGVLYRAEGSESQPVLSGSSP